MASMRPVASGTSAGSGTAVDGSRSVLLASARNEGALMLRAAICGAGHWGTRLIESVQGKSGKIGFTAVVTRDPDGKRELAARFGLELPARYEDVLSDRNVDAVVLATPHSQHASQIVAAAQTGKHVFAEKPFTLTRADAERAIAACRAAGVTLQVGFNRRYAPAYLEMEKRIGAGEIGRLREVEGDFFRAPRYHTEPS